MGQMGLRGPRGEAPKGKKGANFENLLQTQEQQSRNMLHVDTFIYEEYSLFMANARIAPLDP